MDMCDEFDESQVESFRRIDDERIRFLEQYIDYGMYKVGYYLGMHVFFRNDHS